MAVSTNAEKAWAKAYAAAHGLMEITRRKLDEATLDRAEVTALTILGHIAVARARLEVETAHVAAAWAAHQGAA